MTNTVLNILGVIALTAAWSWWDERRGIDSEHEAREAAYAGRLVKRMLLATALLTVSLLLVSLDVPGAPFIVLGAVLVVVVLFYLGPFLGPRRSRD